jgi:endonuclease/exonuclease/phosphatase family metal-dependent hydrolase
MGNVTDTELFLELVANERPDVIAFQELDPEFRDLLRAQLNANEWDWSTEAGLVLASRFKIRSRQAKNRKPFGGWGDIVAKYELTTPAGPVYFFVVHLATPRDGVEAFMARQRDAITEMQRVTTLQAQESSLAASFASPYKPALVAGDFNMLDTNPLFKAYWSKYRDTFSEKGFGFGYTKHTRWHGARIDHILHDPDWQTLEARVGPDIGGDHHPTIARLILSK